MTPEEWKRLKTAYLEIRTLDEQSRKRATSEFAAREPSLGAALEKMLLSDDEPDFMNATQTHTATDQPAGFPHLIDFEIFEELGRGGMGVVYRAKQRSLPRWVALKILRRHALMTPEDVERFHREAAVIAKVSHPHIVTVYEVRQEADTHFFTMELMEGRDLGRALRDLRAAAAAGIPSDDSLLPEFGGRGYSRVVAEIGAAVADALHTAHTHKVVHRDVKPSNILLAHDRVIKLADFGIAKDESLGRLTISHEAPGTPDYMSPEQVRAQRSDVNHRTDVYSLGAVMYEMLTLRRPYEGANQFEIHNRIVGPALPTRIRTLNGSVPRDLEIIVETAMAKDVALRYSSAELLRDDLWRFLAHQAIVAQPPNPARRVIMYLNRHRGAVVATLTIILSAWAALQIESYRNNRREKESYSVAAKRELDAGNLETRPLSALLNAANIIRQFPSDRLGPPPQTLTLLQTRLSAYRHQQMSLANEDRQRGSSSNTSEGERELFRLRWLQRLYDLRTVFPEDIEINGLADAKNVYPTLSVDAKRPDGKPVTAHVSLRLLDVETGQPGELQALGTTPLTDCPVLPGYYRVIVVVPEGGTHEIPCYFGLNSMRRRLEIGDRINNWAYQQMVRIEGCSLSFPYPTTIALGGRKVEVRPFLMDKYETSFQDYRAFLRATGRATPTGWEKIDQSEFNEWPAAGMSWEDAAAYAAWAGKRLPTLAEWLVAAGVAAGRKVPWAHDAADGALRGNVMVPYVPSKEDDRWRAFFDHAKPVTSFPEAATPEGLHNLYGNVCEWTETMAADVFERSPSDAAAGQSAVKSIIPSPQLRLFVGGAWDAASRADTMTQLAQYGISEQHASCRIGFRCAASIEP